MQLCIYTRVAPLSPFSCPRYPLFTVMWSPFSLSSGSFFLLLLSSLSFASSLGPRSYLAHRAEVESRSRGSTLPFQSLPLPLRTTLAISPSLSIRCLLPDRFSFSRRVYVGWIASTGERTRWENGTRRRREDRKGKGNEARGYRGTESKASTTRANRGTHTDRLTDRSTNERMNKRTKERTNE